MKTVTNLVSAVGEIVDRLTLPGREKKQLETDILRLLIAVGTSGLDPGRSPGQLAAKIVATDRDAGLHPDHPRRNVPEPTDSRRHFPLLGFVGNRTRRIHHRTRQRATRQLSPQTSPEITLVFILNSKFPIHPVDILNHRLVDCEAVHLTCSKNTRPLTAPDTIVLHYTAGSNGLASAYYLTRPDVAASAHLVIDRNGDIIQLVPFNVESWHAGKSFHLGRVNLNHYSIGIELDNLGKLRREGEKFIAECGKEVQPSDVFVDEENGQPTYWHRYTDEQLKTVVLVCLLLMDRYPIRYLLRHSDITPRKIDPGPAFPREILELNR